VTSSYFDNFILALILISSGLLAFENTIYPDASINKVGILSYVYLYLSIKKITQDIFFLRTFW